MPKSLSAPKNPEFLVGAVAAMRLLSGERQPRNQPEQEVLARLQSLDLKPEVAKRLVAAFDARPEADRRNLLGRFADKSHVLEGMAPSASPNVVVRDHRNGASSGGTTDAASTSRTGSASGTVGPLSGEATRDGVLPGISYTVRYQGLWCQKETHPDLPGSDEPYVITSGIAINNGVNATIDTLVHPFNTHDKYYDDVDSQEARVGPVAAVYRGSPDTLSLAVVLMEHDEGKPDYYRDEIDTFVKGAIAVASKYWPPAAVLSFFKDNIVDAINWVLDTGDDVISSEVAVWERSALEALAIQTPGEYQGTKRELIPSPTGGFPTYGPVVNAPTGLFVHFVTKHHGDGAEYVVGFDIVRDPPRPGPVIL
ncbi:MAG: hypothetical protein QM719_07245 [Thermomonas sp.]